MPHTYDSDSPAPPEALQRLIDGNRRFFEKAGDPLARMWRHDLGEHVQRPFAIVLGCSDSRTPVEIVYDQGFGDLFVIRIAGNIVAPSVMGSIEFAASQLRSGNLNPVILPTHAAITAAVRRRSSSRYPAARLEQPWQSAVSSQQKTPQPGLPQRRLASVTQPPLLELCTPGRAPFLPIESHYVHISAFNWYESRAMGGMHNSKSSWFFNDAEEWSKDHHSSASSVQEHSLSVIELSRPLVEAIQRKDRDLASQLRRARSSISLNLAEGFGCAGGNARLRFESALGSLKESQAGFRVAVAWGYISSTAAAEALASLHSLGGRVFGLVGR